MNEPTYRLACREEDEKFNVWVAYLNMENLYGSEDATLALLSRALSHTDARRTYLAAVDIFERSQKGHLVEQCLKAMTRKFNDSVEVGDGRQQGQWRRLCQQGAEDGGEAGGASEGYWGGGEARVGGKGAMQNQGWLYVEWAAGVC